MCRWLAYAGIPTHLDSLIQEPEHSLIDQSLEAFEGKTTTNGDGFGLAWYGSRDVPGHYRETRPAWNDRNLASITHQIESSLFLAHVRASTGTAVSRVNCHPFVRGHWSFMHNGAIVGFEHVERAIEAALPDNLYRLREGTTDSELLFLTLLANGLESDALRSIAAMIEAVEQAIEESGRSGSLRMTIALSDGNTLIAARHATRGEPPSIYYRTEISGDESLSTIVVSEPFDTDTESWNAVPAGYVLIAKRGTSPTVQPILN